jgi:hypothetical protein
MRYAPTAKTTPRASTPIAAALATASEDDARRDPATGSLMVTIVTYERRIT